MILTDTRGATRIITLDRPAKRNALDRPLTEALLAALTAAADDPAIRAVVLAANGPGFCAGVDLAEARALASGDPAARASRTALTASLFRAPEAVPKPVVAAVQGGAIGGGAALALCCDLVVMAESARLAFPEAQHGMLPALVAPPLLRHLPPKLVFELLTTARPIPADECLTLALANRVVPLESLLDEAITLAKAAALLPPDAMGPLKKMFAAGPQDTATGMTAGLTAWGTRARAGSAT